MEAGTNIIPEAFDLGRDTTLCPGESVTLGVPPQPGLQYRWQDGSTKPTLTAKTSGVYTLTASAGLCTIVDSVRVTVRPTITLPADTVLCRGESLTLAPRYPGHIFVWSDGSTDSTLRISTEGSYWVRAGAGRCVVSDTIQVRVLDCPGQLPNVFTPNGDGRNEVFFVNNIALRPWGLRVYNRWGQVVYEASVYRNDWDGSGLPAGVYYYELSNTDLGRSLKGWVQLLR